MITAPALNNEVVPATVRFTVRLPLKFEAEPLLTSRPPELVAVKLVLPLKVLAVPPAFAS